MKAEYHGYLDPRYPCRKMPTRHCPAAYNGVCGDDRICARLESEDETPWLAEIVPEERR
jgi:hypothetical protein